jgi:hypothetical protein
VDIDFATPHAGAAHWITMNTHDQRVRLRTGELSPNKARNPNQDSGAPVFGAVLTPIAAAHLRAQASRLTAIA